MELVTVFDVLYEVGRFLFIIVKDIAIDSPLLFFLILMSLLLRRR